MNKALATAALLMLSAPATAADPLPAGWTQREDSAYVHQASTAICPTELNGLKRTRLESKGAPDLGICTYAGDQNRDGLIRVREYVRGAGETPLAIQNDQVLIEPKPGQPNAIIGYRVGPGPQKNGADTRQFVLTFTRNKLLIDCIGRQLASDPSDAGATFAQACVKLHDVK